jgi:Rrf2 family protein
MLTNTAEYALRAVLYLASAEEGAPIRVESIADRLEVPRNYLSKVMHVLARSGTLKSLRGPHGGFSLARPATEITLAEVIDPFDPLEDRCLLMRRRCSDSDPCIAHHRWREVAMQMRAFFRTTTVDDLLRGARGSGGAHPVGLGRPLL